MSISNIEINLSSNGSPHQATVTEVIGKNACDRKSIASIISASKGQSLRVNNDKINNLLSQFVIESITTTVDPSSEKKDYKLIDKLSAILDSYIVLVRGITAPPIIDKFPSPIEFLNDPKFPNSKTVFAGPVFPSSELPLSAFGPTTEGATTSVYKPKAILDTRGSYSSPIIDILGNVVILGSTYSIITQQIHNERSFQTYNKGKKISKLSENSQYTEPVVIMDNGDPPKEIKFIDPLEGQKQDPTKATIKYGYTAKEFFKIFDLLSIKFDKNPLKNMDNVLFETTGNLRDCLSAICSFYGYYWYIQLNSDSNKFPSLYILSSEEAFALTIEDPRTEALSDPSLVSYSFSEGGRSPYTVASFVGNSAPPERADQSPFQIEDTPIHKEFKRVNCEKFFKIRSENISEEEAKTIEAFFLFFYSEEADSTESFDKFFLLGKHFFENFQCDYFYDYKIADKYKGFAKYLNEAASEESADMSLIKETIKNSKYSGAFPIDTSKTLTMLQEEGSPLPLPSTMTVYTIFKNYFKYFGSLFISNGYSKSFTERVNFTGGDISISKAYLGSTKLSEVEELVDFNNFLEAFGIKNVTMQDLANYANVNIGLGTDKYFYIAMLPINKTLGAKTKNDEASFEAKRFEFLEKKVWLGFPLGSSASRQVILYNISTEEEADMRKKINDLYTTSREKFLKAHKNLKERVLVQMSRIDNGPDGTEDSGERERLSFENSIYKIFIPTIDGKERSISMVKAELKTFTGSITDIKTLIKANRSQLIGLDYNLNSASKTYYRLYIPTFSIKIDSISIQFANDGISTTIAESNKGIIPVDQTLILSDSKVARSSNFRTFFTAGQKNFFRMN